MRAGRRSTLPFERIDDHRQQAESVYDAMDETE
jgi:hypothetical protein